MSAFARFNSTEPKVQGQVIGIDLGKSAMGWRFLLGYNLTNMKTIGTTNSAVSIMEGKVPRVIENSEGEKKNPSTN